MAEEPRFLSGWAAWLAANEGTASCAFEQVRNPDGKLEMTVESDPRFGAEPVILEPGEVFAGLEVQEVLGSGGMATVYKAYDPVAKLPVALKLLHRGLVSDTRHLQRFRREARVASRLRHPNIVTTHTYGEVGGAAYLTMHVVEGPTLEEAVEADGVFEPQRAAKVVEAIARALDAAHAQRVVHRDLKPSNIMLHPDDGPLVLDFGLAKHLTHDPNLTETGEILGTPSYLAPEQVRANPDAMDHRIDVYGLGGILFFLLTGRPPHAGESALQVLRAILERDPPRIRDLNPELPGPLEIVCAKALAREVGDRYLTAAAMADDLRRFQAEARVNARLPGVGQRLLRRIRNHPLATAVIVVFTVAAALSGLAVQRLAASVALQDRSERGLELLSTAQQSALEGDYDAADEQFLRAMLETKSAFLEAPDNDVLRAALAQVKLARVAYAESRGNWSLAEELRQNLASLQATQTPSASPTARCTIMIEGLRPGRSMRFASWHGPEETPQTVATVLPEKPSVSLPPGRYLASEHALSGVVGTAFLIVLDPGHSHVLRLDREVLPPPGVYRLPSGLQLTAKPSNPPVPDTPKK